MLHLVRDRQSTHSYCGHGITQEPLSLDFIRLHWYTIYSEALEDVCQDCVDSIPPLEHLAAIEL